jgi:hypothetical protein
MTLFHGRPHDQPPSVSIPNGPAHSGDAISGDRHGRASRAAPGATLRRLADVCVRRGVGTRRGVPRSVAPGLIRLRLMLRGPSPLRSSRPFTQAKRKSGRVHEMHYGSEGALRAPYTLSRISGRVPAPHCPMRGLPSKNPYASEAENRFGSNRAWRRSRRSRGDTG